MLDCFEENDYSLIALDKNCYYKFPKLYINYLNGKNFSELKNFDINSIQFKNIPSQEIFRCKIKVEIGRNFMEFPFNKLINRSLSKYYENLLQTSLNNYFSEDITKFEGKFFKENLIKQNLPFNYSLEEFLENQFVFSPSSKRSNFKLIISIKFNKFVL